MFWPHELPEAGAFLAREAGVEVTDPMLSPAFAEFPEGVPPLRIDVSTSELLRSDAELLADVYRRSGAPVELVMTPGMPHAWPVIGILAQARRSSREIGAWLGAHLDA
jgi:monoterpene epsilon-lactone hydrolase